jgi:hypothetical protein
MLLISAQWHAPQQVEANTGMDLIFPAGINSFRIRCGMPGIMLIIKGPFFSELSCDDGAIKQIPRQPLPHIHI